MKNAILRIFATGSQQREIARQYKAVQAYAGFILVEVPENKAQLVLKNYLSEDITDQYEIRVPDAAHKGKTLRFKDISQERSRPFPAGKHHYLVQFVGPIKRQWLSGVKTAGGELRDAYS